MVHLITGGSGSGKSAYGEDWLREREAGNRLFYVATMEPHGEEALRRILRHRQQRKGKGFETIECQRGLKQVKIPQGCGVLLECLSNLAANELYREDGSLRDKETVIREILEGIQSLQRRAGTLVIVTNEIFSDGTDYGESIRVYQEVLGEINRETACLADQVTEVVYGIPVVVKKHEAIVG